MAAHRQSNGVEKRKRSKKKKSRTEISSSGSDSDVTQKKHRTSAKVVEEEPPAAEKAEKTKKKNPSAITPLEDNNIARADQEEHAESKLKAKSPHQEENFAAIYLRRVAAELADDLDKVRAAQDFKSSSVPMLIHALKQGESIFSVEEKGRVVNAVNTY